MTQLPDFDTLVWLAEHNPEQLTLLQKTLSNEAIAASGNNKEQLECLLFNLNLQLDRCQDTHQRCQIAMDLMSEKLSTLSVVVNNPQFVKNHKAEIFPFNHKPL